MEILKKQMSKHVFANTKYDCQQQSRITSVQFKAIKEESSSTSRALRKELDKSAKTFRTQWNTIKSYH